MKRIALFIFALFFANLTFFSCQKDIYTPFMPTLTPIVYAEERDARNDYEGRTDYQIMLCEMTDSATVAPTALQNTRQYGVSFEAADAPRTIHIPIDGVLTGGTYLQSRYLTGNAFRTDEYADAAGNRFSVDSAGRLAAWAAWGTDTNTLDKNVLTQEECLARAENFLSALVDPAAYRICVSLEERGQQYVYVFEFIKYIHSWESADRARVKVGLDGKIVSFYSTMLGYLSADAPLPPFRLDEVTAAVTEKLDALYAAAREKQDQTVSYESYQYRLTANEESDPLLLCTAEVTVRQQTMAEIYQVWNDTLTFIIE